jgi:hypothetical protein
MVPAVQSPLAKHHPIGASTGYFGRLRGNWNELLAAVERTSTFAAELAALSEPEFGALSKFLERVGTLPFRYLSVHAPVKQRIAIEADLVSWLGALPRNVSSIVTHPDTIEDMASYRSLGNRLVIENMDARKQGGRTVSELGPIFDLLPEAGFCFDIAHAWSVDPSMGLAQDLLDRFGTRLRQVHLSSLDAGKHVPIMPEHEALFAPILDRCRDVPWILEAEKPSHWLPQAV